MPSRARLMASSATRWVRWRTKVKAHVLALICPSHRMLLGLWVAIGALVASAPGVKAEEGQQRYTSRTTPHVTCVTRHAQLPPLARPGRLPRGRRRRPTTCGDRTNERQHVGLNFDPPPDPARGR